MKQISTLDINNIKLAVFGTINEPLFEANKIIVDILEYNELNECRFYKDNKKNVEYVIKLDKSQTGNLPDRVWGNNRYLNTSIYFTEDGLYECLFQSNKPFAQDFRKQIRKLLKDIRIGNIELYIKRECQFTKTLEFKSNQIVKYITKIADIEGQLNQLRADNQRQQQIIKQTTKTLTIYEQRVDDKIYVRSTTRERSISNERNSTSPNKHIRKAVECNKLITLQIKNKQEIVSSDDRKYLVKSHINTINPIKLLNQRIIHPQMSNVTMNISTNNQDILQPIIEYNNEDIDINLEQDIDSVSSIRSELLENELTTFKDCFVGLYIDNELNTAWEQPQYVFNALQLSNNEVLGLTTKNQCKAIELLQTNKVWNSRTELLTKIFKSYINTYMNEPGKMIYLDDKWQISIDSCYWDWIYQFGIKKYFVIFNQLGKTRTSEYFSQIYSIKKLNKGFHYIQSLKEPQNQKQLNLLYRTYLNATISSQKTVHKVFTYILDKKLHELNQEQLQEFLRLDVDNKSRLRENIANYLGYFCYFKEKKVKQKSHYIITLVLV